MIYRVLFLVLVLDLKLEREERGEVSLFALNLLDRDRADAFRSLGLTRAFCEPINWRCTRQQPEYLETLELQPAAGWSFKLISFCFDSNIAARWLPAC